MIFIIYIMCIYDDISDIYATVAGDYPLAVEKFCLRMAR